MAKEYLKTGAVEEAMGYLRFVLSMPDTKGLVRTKVQAAKTLVANAAKISSKKTQLQLDGAVTSMSMADLLAMAGEAPSVPNSGSDVSKDRGLKRPLASTQSAPFARPAPPPPRSA